MSRSQSHFDHWKRSVGRSYVHAPLKPEKLNPIAGVAVKVTVVSLLKFAVHVVGQLIPDGLLVTLPLPASVTVNCVCCGRGGGGLTEPPPQAVSANSEQKTTDKSGNRTRTKQVPLYFERLVAKQSSWVAMLLVASGMVYDAKGTGFPWRVSAAIVARVRLPQPLGRGFA